MFGVTGTAPATKALPAQKHAPAKAISNILTADWFWALCIVIGAILVPAPTPGATTVLGLPNLCIFRNITGIACPGCGMTRSLIATGHLHLEDALMFHPLGPVVFVILTTYGLAFLQRRRPDRQAPPMAFRWQSAVAVLTAIGFGAVWVARLMGYLTTPS
jgi:hypothetical protein